MNNQQIINLINEIETSLYDNFKKEEEIALNNQYKVLSAFRKNQIATRHFSQTEGYGYDDVGRDNLNEIIAQVFDKRWAFVHKHQRIFALA